MDKFNLTVPRLRRDEVRVDEPQELHDRGIRYVIHIPFDGEAVLFQGRPSTWTLNPPQADIRGAQGELVLTYVQHSPDAGQLRQRYERDFATIEEWLTWVQGDVEQCLTEIPDIIAEAISERKRRLIIAMGVLEELGLPVTRRSEAQTVAIKLPRKRRPSPAELPRVPSGPYQYEPTVDPARYDDILDIISHLTIAIERSPSAFQHMGEEHLRDHILIQLNGHFEGSATGETFNGSGKTDILIRANDKNAFIGDCKIWKGKKGFLEALDQLFSYSCWSDTKTAVIVFNRNRNHTRVLSTIQSTTSEHPLYKRDLKHQSETHFRYLFQHPEDQDRSIYVAVLAINLPPPN